MPRSNLGVEQDYTGAAARLLDRKPPVDYVAEWTEHVAATKEIARPGVLSAMIFRIGDEFLALPAGLFQEVAVKYHSHKLPHRTNEVLKGLVNVRGELLLCVALDALLGLKLPTESLTVESVGIYERLLVCDRKGQRIAVPVAEVCAVYRYDPKEMIEVPATLTKAASKFVLGVLRWRERTVGCLNDTLLFNALDKYLS